MRRFLTLFFLASMSAACTEEVGNTASDGGGGAGGGAGGDGGAADPGTPLTVDVPADARVYVDLDEPAVIDPANPATSTDWELAFEGYEIFTSSGPSGPGVGGAFGPLDPTNFLSDTRPDVPFVIADETGGTFLDWYDYDGVTHTIWSRFHRYGVKDELDRVFKVHIISYYGEVAGAPVRAVYQLRWAEVTETGSGETTFIDDLDGTAGGISAAADQPSGCIDLATGERFALTPKQALESSEWHLCFRRDNISVNGELGGPRGVTAADLDTAGFATETIEENMAKTAAGEEPAFDATDFAALTDASLEYRGDRIVTAFGSGWYDEASPPAPTSDVWLVVGADGTASYLVAFEQLEGATADTPGKVHLRVKKVQ
jgi:hypothetical protein